MWRKPTASLVLSFLQLALPAMAAGAQEAGDEPTFYESIDVQVVNLEVFVTDADGRRVSGLTRDDFEVLEDGKPVEITNFLAVGDEAPSSSAAPGATAQVLAPGDPPAEQRLHLAIVVDNQSIVPQARNRLLAASSARRSGGGSCGRSTRRIWSAARGPISRRSSPARSTRESASTRRNATTRPAPPSPP